MQYALLAYSPHDAPADARQEIDAGIAAVLARPNVTGWVRLHAAESATTVRHQDGTTLLTDGPFIDSKEFLAGVILVEADNLDEALAAAAELQELRPSGAESGAIEVRPIRETQFRGA
jgi:hypothetical protein